MPTLDCAHRLSTPSDLLTRRVLFHSLDPLNNRPRSRLEGSTSLLFHLSSTLEPVSRGPLCCTVASTTLAADRSRRQATHLHTPRLVPSASPQPFDSFRYGFEKADFTNTPTNTSPQSSLLMPRHPIISDALSPLLNTELHRQWCKSQSTKPNKRVTGCGSTHLLVRMLSSKSGPSRFARQLHVANCGRLFCV
ncbi:unnamed protein product [Protopolystoma xenopodis]|uniref:Uncharacterized protein n=1 Tax=Protopolystoma xenopodis TaxID=117903 RepID=A0A448WQG5_9PLAT|nr:unnamed protein product [Protopolystoma xenopodis]